MSQLLLRGMVAALASRNVPNARYRVTNKIADRLCTVQVKARKAHRWFVIDGEAVVLGVNLARLLVRRPDGIFVAPFEQGEIGPDVFRACNMGLEGLVSKRREAGRSKHWVKVKNRKHPAMSRVMEAFG